MQIQKSFSFRKLDNTEVCFLINKLEKNKATGLDKISCKLIKIAVDIITPSLTNIFYCSISSEIFPKEWKLACVSPIFKKGAETYPGNYRPISVLPVVAKKALKKQFIINFTDI